MYFSLKLCFVVLAVMAMETSSSPSRVRRQGFSWGDEDDFNFNVDRRPTRPSTSTTTQATNAGTTTTTASPEYNSCIRRCPTTPQYNPICGTNRITYPNESHLRCANSCGLSVQRLFQGQCTAL